MKHKKFYAKLVALMLLVCLLAPSTAVNADEGSWTTLASMSDARGHFCTEVISGKIYAIGGNDSAEILSSAEVYLHLCQQRVLRFKQKLLMA